MVRAISDTKFRQVIQKYVQFYWAAADWLTSLQGFISISWDYHGEIMTLEDPPTIQTILIAGFPGDIDVQHVKYEFDNLHDNDEPPTQPPQYLFVGEQVHQDKEKNVSNCDLVWCFSLLFAGCPS